MFIDIYTVPAIMGAPIRLHKWQARVIQAWSDQQDEEQGNG